MGAFSIERSCGHFENKNLGLRRGSLRRYVKRTRYWLKTPCNACRKAERIARRRTP